jgi:serine/threonine-protein kinase haspin
LPSAFLKFILVFFSLQVTMTLAVAEEACEFEHRDLHWGNLLISRDGTESVPYRLRDVDITVESAGVRVTLIDFTLSRLCTPEGEVAFCDLAADPELFNGPKGDAQVSIFLFS